MVNAGDEAVPRAVDENQVTVRLQRVEILSLIAQSEGSEDLERFAHSMRGTPQRGVSAVTDTRSEPELPPEPFETVTTVTLVPDAIRGFEDEPATTGAFDPEGEPFEAAAMFSDGVPIAIEVPGTSRSLPIGPASRLPLVIRGALIAVAGVAAYFGYAALL